MLGVDEKQGKEEIDKSEKGIGNEVMLTRWRRVYM